MECNLNEVYALRLGLRPRCLDRAAPPVSREWPPGRPVPWGPLAVTAAVVLLAFPTGGVCSTLAIVVLGYAAFSILVTAIEGAWPRRRLEGRARLYHNVAARCLQAAERYPFAGNRRVEGALTAVAAAEGPRGI